MKEIINKLADKIYEMKVNLEYIDLLMIFPSHRRLVAEWKKQNIMLDHYKLKDHKRAKARMRKNTKELI